MEMETKKRFPQVLLMGNGINLAYGGISWNNLLREISKRDDLDFEHLKCPMPLRAVLVTNNHIREALNNYNYKLYGEITNQKQLLALQKVLKMGFDHILTTNYSYELEMAAHNGKRLTDKSLAELMEHTDKVKKAEAKYMLHTYNAIGFGGSVNKVWHIHGEARKPDSMILGHYYYGNYFAKIRTHLEDRGNRFFEAEKHGDTAKIKSWTEAYILGDVYVLGFGYDVSEFDMWWLLNRKQREKAQTGKVYYYTPAPAEFDEKLELLKVFDKVELVSCGISLPKEPTDKNNKAQREKYKKEKEEAYKAFYKLALSDIERRVRGENGENMRRLNANG